MNPDDIIKVVNLGMNGILLWLLSNLWSEFKAQNDYIRTMLTRLLEEQDRAEQQRIVIAKAAGVTESQLNIPVQNP